MADEHPAIVQGILAERRRVPDTRSVLVALSGIDGSGKGYVAERVLVDLADRGVRSAGVNVDGWLNLPSRRFALADPAEHFYRHAVRFEEMFSTLVLPLRDRRSLRVQADFAEETATEFRRHSYHFEDVDVVLVEGIFLLKRSLRPHYDLAVWLDCSFETALERALARAQEGLSPEATVEAYETIYFPAQRIHFTRDDPRGRADLVVSNDTLPVRPAA